MKKTLLALCILSLFGMIGCETLVAPDIDDLPHNAGLADTGEPQDTAAQPQDTETTDTTHDAGVDAGQPEDVRNEDRLDNCALVPLECSENNCDNNLRIDCDNGHGNVSTCLTCDCELLQTSCGNGDLGINFKCDNQTDDDCDIPEIPGFDEDSKFIYVHGERGRDSNSGLQPQDAVKTILNALNKAQSYNDENTEHDGQVVAIIIAGNTSDVYESGPLTILNGVSLLAGYDNDFKRNPGYRPTIHVSLPNETQARGDVFGLTAKGIDEKTVLHGFHLTTADAITGFSNYAIYAEDSDKLVLDKMTIQAGNGGDGTKGKAGEKGADGGGGNDSAWRDKVLSGAVVPEVSTRGDGGKNAQCPTDTTGGNGGQGAAKDGSKPASPGSSIGTTQGGSAGKHAQDNGIGGDGEDSKITGPVGSNGAGGTSGGTVESRRWLASGDGQKASDGSNGGGGGGGGGGDIIPNKDNGNSGGGGGAGGCGGKGGEGGKAGGASFALFLVDSDIKIARSAIRAGSGGKGGDGNIGGEGGAEGKGGSGKGGPKNYPPGAGNGGSGAKGTTGGHGGGAAGGVSYTAYCHESSKVSLVEGTQLYAGSTAPGGKGAGDEQNGSTGITEEFFNCEL